MFIVVEENPNCGSEERQFSDQGTPRPVKSLYWENESIKGWMDITGLDENGKSVPPLAVMVEDSGAGIALLIYGGAWGLRLKPEGSKDTWDFNNSSQWGVPFLVLDHATQDIRFQWCPGTLP